MELFKYMKYRSNFFENRLVRFTPISMLNDPFEGRISHSSISENPKIRSGVPRVLNNEGIAVEISHEKLSDMIVQTFSELDNELCVFSMSSSKHSLLMWAHYADSHKGIIVGFDSNHPFFNHHISSAETSGHLALGKVYPVSYERVRLGFDDSKIRTLHKSDEWMYEKEYRIFMVRGTGDKHLFDNEGNDIDLFEIPEDAITRIIIGANADVAKIVGDFKIALSENIKLKHIILEYAIPHKDLFHIDHHRIELS